VSSTGRAKRDRERARQERAARKRTKRLSDAPVDGSADPDDESVVPAVGARHASQSELLAELALLHQRFEDGAVGFEEFESTKGDLIRQLDVG
jgi:hypothetical protein